MGHRANYVVRQAGKVELFYSHWGALHILRDLFWGPDTAARMIHASEPTDGLLDDVWCEGAALIDHDSHHLQVYGVECGGGWDERLLLLELYHLTWPGWRTEYATGGIGQIAVAIGIDPAPLTRGMRVEPMDEEEIGPYDPEGHYQAALLTSHEPVGYTDRLVGGDVLELLAAGPSILDKVRSLPTVDPTAKEVREHIGGGAVIDAGNRIVSFFTSDERWRPEDQIATSWPGWSVCQQHEGLRFHFKETNRSPPPPDPACADRVLAFLGGSEFDGVELMKRAVAYMQQDSPGEMQVNPSALEHAKAEIGISRRMDTLRRAAAYLGRPLPTSEQR